MKMFEDFDTISEKEKFFIDAIHLNELNIKFNFFLYENDLMYFDKFRFMFSIHNNNNKTLYLHHSIFSKCVSNDINIYMMMRKCLDINVNNIEFCNSSDCNKINRNIRI